MLLLFSPQTNIPLLCFNILMEDCFHATFLFSTDQYSIVLFQHSDRRLLSCYFSFLHRPIFHCYVSTFLWRIAFMLLLFSPQTNIPLFCFNILMEDCFHATFLFSTHQYSIFLFQHSDRRLLSCYFSFLHRPIFHCYVSTFLWRIAFMLLLFSPQTNIPLFCFNILMEDCFHATFLFSTDQYSIFLFQHSVRGLLSCYFYFLLRPIFHCSVSTF